MVRRTTKRSAGIVVLAAALLASLLGFAFAQGTPVTGGTLRVAITGDPPTLDPHTSTDRSSLNTSVPSWLTPTVLTFTMPLLGSDLETRSARTVEEA